MQIIPRVARAAKELYVFQRTPSAIDIRGDTRNDPGWAASLTPGWQRERLHKHMQGPVLSEEEKSELAALPRG